MLDEAEYAQALELYVSEMREGRRDAPALTRYYRELTGVDGGHPHAARAVSKAAVDKVGSNGHCDYMRNAVWNVSEAKSRFSELINKAQSEPQTIENRGKEVAVLVGISEYAQLRNLQAQQAPATRLAAFLSLSHQTSPDDDDYELELAPRRDRENSFGGELG